MRTWTVGSDVTINGRAYRVVAAHVAAGPVDAWCLDAPDGTRYRYAAGSLVVIGTQVR